MAGPPPVNEAGLIFTEAVVSSRLTAKEPAALEASSTALPAKWAESGSEPASCAGVTVQAATPEASVTAAQDWEPTAIVTTTPVTGSPDVVSVKVAARLAGSSTSPELSPFRTSVVAAGCSGG